VFAEAAVDAFVVRLQSCLNALAWKQVLLLYVREKSFLIPDGINGKTALLTSRQRS